jgi:hypothetical protein
MLTSKKPPGPSTKTIVLPSEGYPYTGYPDLLGGNILVKAFTYDIESLMYGSQDSPSKQYARLLLVLKRIAEWPKEFEVKKLLEGDSAFIVTAARSISYPDQTYDFETTCDVCKEPETHHLRIPEQLPQNRYVSDFKGYITLETFNDNVLDIRFLTLEDDQECLRITRDRVSKKFVSEEMFDADYDLNRLGFHLLRANGQKPDHLEDARNFFKGLPFDEREEIKRTIRKHSPGLSSTFSINCPKCGNVYEAYMPLNMDFFRAGTRTIRVELLGGVRLGVKGPNDFSGKPNSAPKTNNAADTGDTGPGRKEETAVKQVAPAPVIDPYREVGMDHKVTSTPPIVPKPEERKAVLQSS